MVGDLLIGLADDVPERVVDERLEIACAKTVERQADERDEDGR